MLQTVGIFLLAEALAEAAKFYWLKLLSFIWLRLLRFIFRGKICGVQQLIYAGAIFFFKNLTESNLLSCFEDSKCYFLEN